MNIAKSGAKLYVMQFASAIATFVGITLFARKLGPSQMGVFFLFQALLGMTSIPADFGIRGAIEKRISEGEPAGGVITTAAIIKSAFLLVFAGVIFVFAGFINRYVGADLAGYLILVLIVSEFAKGTVNILSGELRVGETAALRLVERGVWAVAGGVLVYAGFGVEALVYGLVIAYLAMLVWGVYRCTITIARPSVETARSLLAYGRYDFVTSGGWYVFNWMDVAVIGFFVTQSAVGAYEISWRVTTMVILFSNVVATTVFPQLSAWDAEAAYDRIERLLPRAITASLLLVIPSFFGVAVLAREALTLVFGPGYAVAWLALIVLMGQTVLQAVDMIVARGLRGVDRPDLTAKSTIVAIVINLILNVALVQAIGTLGAAIATATSYGVLTGLNFAYLSRHLTLRFPWTELVWCLGSAAGMNAVLLGVKSALVIDRLPELAVVIALGAVVYFALLSVHDELRNLVITNVAKAIG